MNLNKDVKSWAAVKADAVATMSQAAQQNVLQMALEDIQRLGAEVEMLKEFANPGIVKVNAEAHASATALVVQSVADQAFEDFKTAYKPLGFRNNWKAARKKFDLLVKKEKVNPEAIVAGAQAYARTQPQKQFVPAPEVWLNKRQFEYDWAQSAKKSVPSQADVERYYQDNAR